MGRTWVVVLLLMSVVACRDRHTPTQPTPEPAPPSADTAAAVFVTPASATLPIGGGTTAVDIYTSTASSGLGAARFVPVHVDASGGSLSARDVTTDGTGHVRIEWSGDRTAT